MTSAEIDRVLVTGAAGFIGTRLCRSLRADGVAVRGIARPEHDTRELLAAGVDVVAADARDAEALAAAAAGCETIFHLAAARGAHKLSRAEYRARNRQLAEAVAAAASRAGARRVVFASTASVLGRPGPGRQSETTTCRPISGYAASKLHAESVLEAHARQSGLGLVVARVCRRVLGPGARAWARMFQAVKDRRIPVLPLGGVLHSGDVDDIVDGLRRCAVTPGVDGERFLIAAAEPMPVPEVLDEIARLLGVRFAPVRVTPTPFRAYAAIGDLAFGWLGVALPYHYECELYARRSVLDIGRARARLGFAPAYTMRESIERTATWLRAEALV